MTFNDLVANLQFLLISLSIIHAYTKLQKTNLGLKFGEKIK